MIDTKKLRADFPLLYKSPELIYFDNSCMSLRPHRVIEAMSSYYETMSACAGRSNHRLAAAVSEAVDKARDKVKRFLGAKHAEEIVFTRNTSESFNLVAQSIDWLPGDLVVISDKEHNSNLVPWLRLQAEKGIRVEVVRSTDSNEADLHAYELVMAKKPRLVSIVMTANLDGVTNPVKEITNLAHRAGALVMIDAAQAAPHQLINVRQLDVDFLAFSAHKLCGPSGMGILYGKKHLLDQLQPFMVGGDTVVKTTYTSYEMLPVPEKFEAGLQDYAGIIGTGEAVSYISEIGLEAIHDHEVALTKRLTAGLEKYDRVVIIGPQEAKLRGGINSFYVKDADHHQVSLLLDKLGNIMVRSGQHCVHSWFADRNLAGSVRASFYFYNTPEEVDRFLEVFKKVMDVV
jgi:cysteine desulfurase / selenocysteine lyase